MSTAFDLAPLPLNFAGRTVRQINDLKVAENSKKIIKQLI